MVTVALPSVAVELACNSKVKSAGIPFCVTVTDGVVSEVTPDGRPESVNVTVPRKPFSGTMPMVFQS